ncbi:MAG: mannitol dehydrogenase family protein, partial [Treponema sp.]|nr:mannitol dehydrogenase family protein [Treponema sp.]
MKLTEKGIENLTEWKNKGYICPDFNIELVKKNTVENPTWIHFGAGNIFRAFQANL